MENRNGKPKLAETLAGAKKALDERTFPVNSLSDVLNEIRRAGGTGKLELNFKNGFARGEAKWHGYSWVNDGSDGS